MMASNIQSALLLSEAGDFYAWRKAAYRPEAPYPVCKHCHTELCLIDRYLACSGCDAKLIVWNKFLADDCGRYRSGRVRSITRVLYAYAESLPRVTSRARTGFQIKGYRGRWLMIGRPMFVEGWRSDQNFLPEGGIIAGVKQEKHVHAFVFVPYSWANPAKERDTSRPVRSRGKSN